MLTQTSAARSGQTGRTVRTNCARRTGGPVQAPAGAPGNHAACGMPTPRRVSTAGAVRGRCAANTRTAPYQSRPTPYPARPASNPPYPGRPAPYPAQRPASAPPRQPQNRARLARRRARRRRQMLRRRLAMLVILAVTAGLLAAWEPWAHLPDAFAKPANALLALTGLRVLPAAADAGTPPAASAAPTNSSAPAASTAPAISTTPAPHDGITGAERAALDELCAGMPGSFSLILLDLESGDEYAYRPDTPYTAASLVKAPYALWLCQRADAGEIDLAQPIPYPADCWQSSGMLAGYAGQQTIDPALLMTAMLAQSSNEAARALAATWPTDDAFHAFLREELGFSNPESCCIDPRIRGSVTARDLQNTLEALNAYFAGGAAHTEALRGMMLAAEHEILWIPEGTQAAKKYGSWDGAFHDTAIVSAPHPYLAIALSDWGDRNVDRPAAAMERMRQAGQLAWAVTQNQTPPDA